MPYIYLRIAFNCEVWLAFYSVERFRATTVSVSYTLLLLYHTCHNENGRNSLCILEYDKLKAWRIKVGNRICYVEVSVAVLEAATLPSMLSTFPLYDHSDTLHARSP